MGSLVSGITGFIGGRQQLEATQEDFLSGQQFSAQQAALNRQFQAQQQTSAEDWMSQMSDTAMQRRVQDLKAANLNPLLAISQGGASTPGISAPGGSMGSSPGVPNIPNPIAAGMQSAQQAASIKAYQAQADLASAQAKKTVSETPSTTGEPGVDPDTGEVTVRDPTHALGNALINQIVANTGLQQAQAVQVGATVQQILHTIENTDQNTALQYVQTLLQSKNYEVAAGTVSALISIANADARMKGLETDAFANMSVAQRNAYLGPVIGVARDVLGPVASGIGIARGVRLMAPQGTTPSTGGQFGNPDTVTGAPNMVR